MSRKEIIEVVNEIEEGFPVHTLTFKGVKIWPLVRLTHTYFQTVKRKKQQKEGQTVTTIFGTSHTKTNTLKNLIKNGFLKSLFVLLKERQYKPNKPVDYLSIINYEDRITKVKGAHFSNIIDGLATFMDGRSHIILEVGLFAPPKLPRYSHSKIISPWLVIDFIKAEIISKLFHSRQTIKNLGEYQVFLENQKILANTDKKYLLRYTNRILLYKKRFLKYFKTYQPKVVFIPSTYSPIYMGAILACNELEIKSIDVQHGAIGTNHLMYANWDKLPKEGYELLPQYYWTWGKLTGEPIENWTKSTTRHQVITGGNPWLSYCLENDLPENKKEIAAFEKLIAPQKKVVLLSLQLIQDFKESCLIEAMQKEKEDVLWLIRLHPNFRKFIPELKDFLAEKGCGNYEFELANKLSIYYLFKKIDLQVSFWSTVISEALSFGVPTIIIHPNGYELMKDYIEKDILKYTQDAEELLQFIKNGKFQPEGKEKYMDVSGEKIRSTLKKLTT